LKLYLQMPVLFGDGHLFFNWAEVATLRSKGELLLGFYLSGDSSECAVRARGKAKAAIWLRLNLLIRKEQRQLKKIIIFLLIFKKVDCPNDNTKCITLVC
jgi:hypothetical protein